MRTDLHTYIRTYIGTCHQNSAAAKALSMHLGRRTSRKVAGGACSTDKSSGRRKRTNRSATGKSRCQVAVRRQTRSTLQCHSMRQSVRQGRKRSKRRRGGGGQRTCPPHPNRSLVSKRCWSAFYSIFFRAFSSVRWQREGKGSTYQRVSTRSANRIAPCQSQWRIPRDRSLSWRSNPSVNGGFCLGATQRLSPPPFPPFSLSRSLSFPGQRKSGSGIHRSLGKSWPWIDINRDLFFSFSRPLPQTYTKKWSGYFVR